MPKQPHHTQTCAILHKIFENKSIAYFGRFCYDIRKSSEGVNVQMTRTSGSGTRVEPGQAHGTTTTSILHRGGGTSELFESGQTSARLDFAVEPANSAIGRRLWCPAVRAGPPARYSQRRRPNLPSGSQVASEPHSQRFRAVASGEGWRTRRRARGSRATSRRYGRQHRDGTFAASSQRGNPLPGNFFHDAERRAARGKDRRRFSEAARRSDAGVGSSLRRAAGRADGENESAGPPQIGAHQGSRQRNPVPAGSQRRDRIAGFDAFAFPEGGRGAENQPAGGRSRVPR